MSNSEPAVQPAFIGAIPATRQAPTGKLDAGGTLCNSLRLGACSGGPPWPIGMEAGVSAMDRFDLCQAREAA